MMSKVLLIDDDANLREVITFALREQGHEVSAYADGRSALAGLADVAPDVVVTDLKMPGMDGLGVLERVHRSDPTIPVIILTAFGSIEDAVEAMKRGAHDYLTKPFNRDELKLTVEKAAEQRRLVRENKELRERLREQTRRFEFVHASEASVQLLEMVKRIAPTDATVLITGESGTGKEVIAQALHGLSDRWDRPFVAINCAAIPRDLMESELFGHARGAFTGATTDKPGKFQRADKGTLFLDEIGDLQADLQTKLLRVIETRLVDVVGGTTPVQVDVRLIAATNTDLGARVREGLFRSDLYYRLNVIPIHIPPLRERLEDIPALWEHFVRKYADGVSIRSTPGLIRALMRRAWPGNVRELANFCQRTILLRLSDTLDEAGMLPSDEALTGPAPVTSSNLLGELPEDHMSLPGLERELIVRALAKQGGNRTRTAEYLGIPRHVLLYRMEKFAIE
jgi:two-component system NtrC family response regulator